MADNYENFIYMEEHGFIFAYVPKVACTNWKSLLRYMAGQEDWLNNKRAHDKVNGGLRYLDLSGPDAALLSDPGIKKYTMVRDPYSRALSAYLNKVESRLPLGPFEEGEDYFTTVARKIDDYRQDVLGASTYPEITFEVFLLWLFNEAGIHDEADPMRADEHWAPQTVLLHDPEVQFDIMGRFETIAEDAPRLLEAMGCDQPFPTQKDVKFAATGAQEKLHGYLTATTKQLLSKLFAADIKAFEYPMHNLPSSEYLYNRDNGFYTVAEPYAGDIFVREHFVQQHAEPTVAAKSYLRFLDQNQPLRLILSSLGEMAAREGSDTPITVTDCGVYMGMFAIAAGLLCQREQMAAQIAAYEANPLLIDSIKHNLEFYGVEAQVHNAGVGGAVGTLEFVFAEGRMIGGTLSNPDGKKNSGAYSSMQCDIVPLADILLDVDRPGLVKLDIEGSEVAAFRSICDAPRCMNNVFIIEYADWQGKRVFGDGTYSSWLHENFRVYGLGSWAHATRPIPLSDSAAVSEYLVNSKRKSNVDLLLVPHALETLISRIETLV